MSGTCWRVPTDGATFASPSPTERMPRQLPLRQLVCAMGKILTKNTHPHQHMHTNHAKLHQPRLRQKKIDDLKKKQRGGPVGKRVIGGALSALGRKLNKLTAQEDPELAVDDHIEIEDEDEDDDEVGGGVQ